MRRAHLVVLILAAVIGMSGHLGLGRAAVSSLRAMPMVGYAAPDFTLKGLDGERYQLSAYRGKVVFLNFWASW